MGTLFYLFMFIIFCIVIYLLKLSGSFYLIGTVFFLLLSLTTILLYVSNIKLQNRLVKSIVLTFYIVSAFMFKNIDHDDKVLNGMNKSLTSTIVWSIGLMVIIFLAIFPDGKSTTNQKYFRVLFWLLSLSTVAFIIYYTFKWLASFTKIKKLGLIAKQAGKYTIIALMCFVALAIFVLNAETFVAGFERYDVSNFIYTLIIYIPCMFIDFVKFIKKELRIAPSETYLLLIIEAILIVFYFLYPTLLRKYNLRNAVLLLNKPKYLDSYYELGTTRNLGKYKTSSWNPFKNKYKKNIRYSDETLEAKEKSEYFYEEYTKASWDISLAKINNDGLGEYTTDLEISDMNAVVEELSGNYYEWDISYNKLLEGDESGNYDNKKNELSNYSLSLWLNINSTSNNLNNSNDYTELFNYGNKIKINYSGINSESYYNNTIEFLGVNILGEGESLHRERNISLQKWNHIFINYTGGIVDIFINGLLVSSTSIVLNNGYNIISLGEDNGISGSIANVVYYPKILDAERINGIYNLSKNNDPPII
jgi:hypothetical protein